MNNLIAKTDVCIGRRWYKAGDPVPGDVAGYNYEKAARKGMIESADGESITNPGSEDAVQGAEASVTETRVQQLERELLGYRSRFDGIDVSALKRERDEAQRKVTSLGEQVGKLTTQLGEATRKAETSEADAQALAEYREVVGPLLPKDFPGRKVLLDNGYYTVDVVRSAADVDLTDLDGIAEGTLEKIRKVAPFTPPAE